MDVDRAAIAKVAEILEANPDGISRAGLLAWARLRISPDFSDAQLDAALAELGPWVSVESGLIRSLQTRPPEVPAPGPRNAGSAAPGMTMVGPSPAPTGVAEPPDGQPVWSRWGVPEPPVPTGMAPAPAAGWTAGRPLSRLGRSAIVAVAVAAMIGLGFLGRNAGDGSSAGSSAIPSDPRGSITPAGALSVGTCFVIPTASEFSEVEVRPCDAPHDGEIIAIWRYDAPSGDPYPTDAQWDSAATDRCETAFRSYTGTSFAAQSELDYGWFRPTEAGWKAGDHTAQCYLGLAGGGPVTRSYRAGT